MIGLIGVLIFTFSFAVCPSLPDVSLELESETVSKVGREFRRADLMIFIPVNTRDLVSVSSLRTDFRVSHVGEDLHRVKVRITNLSPNKVEDAYLIQEGSVREESIEGRKVISRLPLIVEPVDLLPTDLEEDEVVVKLPPLRAGEEVEVSYLVSGRNIKPPKVVGGAVEKERRVYLLVAKYSVLFPFGSAKTEDVNIRNMKEVLEGLRRSGLKPIVRVVGIADGKTSDPEKNRRVAEGRARFLAYKVLGTEYACYLRRGFAGDLKEPSP